MLHECIRIAMENECAFHEHINGAWIFEFPRVNRVSPILITADGGWTWSPEAMTDFGPFWKGHTGLMGNDLKYEITRMCNSLQLGDPTIMLKVVDEIEETLHGKLFS